MALNLDPIRANELVNSLFSKNPNIKVKLDAKRIVRVVPLLDTLQGTNIANAIKQEISKRYPTVQIKEDIDGNLIKIKAISQGSSGRIYITSLKNKKSSLLEPGKAYEAYFHSFLVDGLIKRKDIREALDLSITELDQAFKLYLIVNTYSRKRISIGPINSVSNVAGKNKKTDEEIRLVGGKRVNISLKQENFWWWSGAESESINFSVSHRKALDEAIKAGLAIVNPDDSITFKDNLNGIRIPASIDEVRKYAFNIGSGADVVDYVVVNAGNPKQFYEGNGRIVITINGNDVFDKNIPSHLEEIRKNMYMIIYKKGNRELKSLSPYKNVSVMYVNKRYALNGRYIDFKI